MEITRSFYIDGKWVDPVSPQDIEVENPATEEVMGVISAASAEDVDLAAAAAKAALPAWSQTSIEERRNVLNAVKVAYEERLDDLATAIMQELGCPIDLSRNAQAMAGLGTLNAFIEALDELHLVEPLKNGNVIHREAQGVAGLITPWNWPLNQIGQKVFAAMAAGCTVVLKPSEMTPFNAVIFAQIMHEAGVPKGVFNLINGRGDAGAALSAHPDVDCVSFTGSTRAGQAVYETSAPSIKPVSLELGGKSASLIFADCDVKTAVEKNLQKLFPNSGQNCNAPTRLLVERSVYEEAQRHAADFTQTVAVGDPSQHGDHLGTVANKRQYDHIQRLMAEGIAAGASVVAGGPGKPAGLAIGHFVRPTVFADVSNAMSIAQEEIFGPVTVMIPFDTEEEAISIANDSDYGLAAYIYSGDEDRIARVIRRLEAGMVFCNGRDIASGSPFGGVKRSGIGREGGIYGVEEFLNLKLVA